MTSSPEFYTVAEVAEIWRVTEVTVRNMIADGRLVARKLGRAWRIPSAAVLRASDIAVGSEVKPSPSGLVNTPDSGQFALSYQP